VAVLIRARMKKPLVLLIRDGWGISPNGLRGAHEEGNATLLAKTPFHDHLYKTYPGAKLSASGEDVGLPAGQMGNSEVGHLNLGAGRIVYQDLTRIDLAIKKGEFGLNPVLQEAFSKVIERKKTLHLVGLVSDGGVHSHIMHLLALIDAAKAAGVKSVYIHVITDGRDTSPFGGVAYLEQLQAHIVKTGTGKIVTVVGRYFAMDRDKRWERTRTGYDCIVSGKGEVIRDPVTALKNLYVESKTDEFIPALVVGNHTAPLVKDNDVVLFFNFRSDRARQLSQALMSPEFSGFERAYRPNVDYYTMTQYDPAYTFPVLYAPQSMSKIFGEVVASHGLSQLRIAETEKYPHISFFFNGGVEQPYSKEERVLVQSPKVATYDLQPEMNAEEVTSALLKKLKTAKICPDVIILNFANPDMVGHTGVLKAAIKAVETIDACVKQIVERVLKLGGHLLITADHGNCERMLNPDKSIHTAHTTNLVHFYYVSEDASEFSVDNGILADVAPTLLNLLNIPQPPEMTGKNLVRKKFVASKAPAIGELVQE